jgi:3-hydroxymyristoyl/3-hydroxydecanoyl-(acyl carrier protein) dehydratase
MEKNQAEINAPEYPEKNIEKYSPLFDRRQCLAFAVGDAGTVLGEKFNIIDTYPVRVRLPDEPLMLVDRIISIEGEMLSMGPGKIITQHDVKPDAWYLDGGKAPVSISIEAGQADLFLCSWMGIDHQVKGHRRYRLLDARVTFHRPLPQPGETIEYHIVIDRFLKQGEVYLFFFHYEGYINNALFMSMRDGCAGFFTPLEVENSGGIILKKEETAMDERFLDFQFPVQVQEEQYTENQVEALRHGDLETCFGSIFKGMILGKKLRLPGGRMHLIDRVMAFDPTGGRFGLGIIIAEADIHPDDWFLTCHFVDDKVMPGTLMYECCAHALRIFTQRVGWISPRDDVHYDIIPGMESDLKCRGPVTPETKKARYEIEVKEMGYHPEPFVVADAHMFSDDHRIVLYKNMGMKLVGLSRREIEHFWSNR